MDSCNTHIFSHDFNPIVEHKSSHSSHDDALRVFPSQVDNISNGFDKLDTWLSQENQNPDSIIAIEALKKIVNNDENNISILHGISHLITTHA